MHYDKFYKDAVITDLQGLEVLEVSQSDDELTITGVKDGKKLRFRFFHDQDCCEHVAIYDVKGDINGLVGQQIYSATEEVSSYNWPDDVKRNEYEDSWTWTTYIIIPRDAQKRVIIRWLGESNGYYSESVSLVVEDMG